MKRSPIIYTLFFLSGISALIYEVIWTRMLTLVFGHTVYSVSIVLAAFMAGLGLGSYLWGHLIDRIQNPLLVYGKIEILIAILCAVLSCFFASFGSLYSWLHIWIPEHAGLLGFVKGVLAFALMILPTSLMGATLPIITKYYVTDNTRLGTQVGLLYGINTLGAVSGCLLSGYVLISVFGVLETVLIAAGINFMAGVGAIRVFQETEGDSKIGLDLPKPQLPRLKWTNEEKFWIALSCLSGFTALAYEVLWTRLLVFSIASTVYSFSMMLAVFLMGIVLGSFLVIPILKHFSNLRTVLIILQGSIGAYTLVSLFAMEEILSAPWNSYNLQNPVAAFLHYFKDSSVLMLIPTLLLGMNFPILTRLVAKDPSQVGGSIGRIYAFNTLGAILGSLVAGFFLLPAYGVQQSLAAVATLNLLAAAALFASGSLTTAAPRKVIAIVCGGFAIAINFVMPDDLLKPFFMRDSAGKRSEKKLLYFDEGLTDTVAIFKDNYGLLDPEAKRLITNGISMSASNMTATRYMKLFAHVPILLHSNPQDVLVICFGTGQTVGAAGIHSTVSHVEAVDLSPEVIHSGKVFAKENHDALNNPKVHITYQDGRNYLLTTQKKFDVITAEPPPPRTASTVNLYTREYYKLTKNRLKPGGMVAQWIPLHSQSEAEVYQHFRTFRSVFPHALAWMSVANEILVIGSEQPIDIDFYQLQTRFEDPLVRKALQAIEIDDVFGLLSCLWFLEEQIDRVSAGQPVISDNHPSIEFYLKYPDVISNDGLEKIVFNRLRFQDMVKRIRNLPEQGRQTLHLHYRAMDLYQRGVIYNNQYQLREAAQLIASNNLFRYHLQGERSQIARLKQRVELNPNDTESLLNLGHSYFQIGKFDESQKYLKLAQEKDPQQKLADLYLAYNFMETGRRKEAREIFESIGKQDPRFLRNLVQDIGLIQLLDRLEKDKDNIGLILATAQYYNMKNDYRRSLKYSLEVLDKDPLNEQALQSVLISFRGLGEPKEVFMYGMQYERANPDDINFQYIMAEMHVKMFQCELAVPYLEKVLKQDDTYQNAEKLMQSCRENEQLESPAA